MSLINWKSLPLDHFDELIGLHLTVPCNTWNNWETIWGEGMDELRTTSAKIKKVSINRRSHRPVFEISFDEIGVTYGNFDLGYVMKYLNDIPAKYTTMAAQMIVAASNAAAATSLGACSSSMHEPPIGGRNDSESTPLSEKVSKKKRKRLPPPPDSDVEPAWDVSDVEEDDFPEETKEDEEFRKEQEDYASEMLPPDEEEFPNVFNESSWKVNVEPVQHIPPFVGACGPSFEMKEEDLENPLKYFSLFIPFWMKQ